MNAGNESLSEAECIASGKQWASTANKSDIKRMVELAELVESADWARLHPNAYGAGAVIADVVLGEGFWNRRDLEDFCEEWLGAPYPAREQVGWFILGAASVK